MDNDHRCPFVDKGEHSFLLLTIKGAVIGGAASRGKVTACASLEQRGHHRPAAILAPRPVCAALVASDSPDDWYTSTLLRAKMLTPVHCGTLRETNHLLYAALPEVGDSSGQIASASLIIITCQDRPRHKPSLLHVISPLLPN